MATQIQARQLSGKNKWAATGGTLDQMNLTTTKTLLDSLEESPESVQLHHGELVRLNASCMDAIYELSVSGENNERKMALVGIEYRERLLLDRYKKLAVN